MGGRVANETQRDARHGEKHLRGEEEMRRQKGVGVRVTHGKNTWRVDKSGDKSPSKKRYGRVTSGYKNGVLAYGEDWVRKTGW